MMAAVLANDVKKTSLFFDNYGKARILELAQSTAGLYSGQSQEEKRKLLSCVYSNSTFAGGELSPNFRKQFDMIAETNDVRLQKGKSRFS